MFIAGANRLLAACVWLNAVFVCAPVFAQQENLYSELDQDGSSISFYILSAQPARDLTAVKGEIRVHIREHGGMERNERLFFRAACVARFGTTLSVTYSQNMNFDSEEASRNAIEGLIPPDGTPKEPYDLWMAVCSDSTASRGQSPSYWNLNGSIMYLIRHGAIRRFYYNNPRDGMRDEGVIGGTLQFDGQQRGNRYDGTAYVFSKRCGAFSYQVSGEISGNGRGITMRGKAPQVDLRCQIAAYRDSILIFDYQ